jgi:MFS family permease
MHSMTSQHDLSGQAARGSISLPTRLGVVSFFNDCSSEVIARALPLYLTASLGLSPTFVGAIEGIAESASILLKGISGWLSDRHESRKPLVVFGYSLSILSRISLVAVQIPILFGLSRLLDRTGKGLRSAPRDAMVADATAQGFAGRDFGITRFLDTLGAVCGILTVLAFGVGTVPMDTDQFHTIIMIAVPFGAMSLAVLWFWVPRITRMKQVGPKLSWHVPPQIRGYLSIVFVFALANSSDAFLVLRAKQLGFSFRDTLFMLVAFNLISAFLAIPAGILSDKFGRVRFLGSGWMIYGLTYLTIGMTDAKAVFIPAILVYGAFYGFTEGVEKALLSDLLPKESKGTGFGAFQLVLGLSALPASLITGYLMTQYGSSTAFVTCGVTAILASVLLIAWGTLRRQTADGRSLSPHD